MAIFSPLITINCHSGQPVSEPSQRCFQGGAAAAAHRRRRAKQHPRLDLSRSFGGGCYIVIPSGYVKIAIENGHL